MSLNKKPIKLLNPTKYFVLGKDRTHIVVSSPNTYKAGRVRQVGFENRLYYEYKYCQDHNGVTFYFTLTYCDKKVPKYVVGKDSFPCFDYQHLVWLLNGGFKKKLLREYGVLFRYFVSCELGEGKGKRGFENNPHYHILFFLRPVTDKRIFKIEKKTVQVGFYKKDSKYHSKGEPRFKTLKTKIEVPYKISDIEFRSLLRIYWQGFDEDLDKLNHCFHKYQNAHFGIVKEGKLGIAVTSFHACQYVAKYVMKDINIIHREKKIEELLRKKYSKQFSFYDLSLRQKYLDIYYKDWREIYPFSFYIDFDVDLILDSYQCKSHFRRWIETQIEDAVSLDMSEYRNRYSNKVRISNGVGEYALDHLDFSTTTPTMLVPGPDGNMMRPIGLYYYRKLYTDVLKNQQGNNIRVLNEAGIEFRKKRIQEQVDKLATEIESKYFALDRELFNKMCSSELNDSVNIDFGQFNVLMQYAKNGIFKRYAEYKLVYENRLTAFYREESTGVVEFPDIDLSYDYARFIKPSFFDNRYCVGVASYLKRVDCEGYLSYSAHPYFRDDLCVFSVFDLLTDYLFVETDNKNEDEFKKRRQTERYHSRLAMKEYYRDKL